MALGCTALILKMFCTFEPFSFYISSPPALNQVDLDLLENKNNYTASCQDGVEVVSFPDPLAFAFPASLSE